jgi:hypothetical protein
LAQAEVLLAESTFGLRCQLFEAWNAHEFWCLAPKFVVDPDDLQQICLAEFNLLGLLGFLRYQAAIYAGQCVAENPDHDTNCYS